MRHIATSSPLSGLDGLLSSRQLRLDKAQAERTISVHVAECDRLRSKASMLLNRMYAWRGYGDAHELAGGLNRATFTACADEEVIGTLTLTVDGPTGLATDHTFETELEILRAVPGTVLCDLTKLAVDPTTKSPAVLASLFHVVFLYGIRNFGCTDVVIEVHPRHVRYYEAMVGFERVGAPKIDPSVEWWPSDTPVQLMRLNLRDMRRLIESCRVSRPAGNRSLYPYFFDQEEEGSIVARIARLKEGASASPAHLAPARVTLPDYWREAA